MEDETWWSRLAQPTLHAWSEPEEPLRLVEQTIAPDDPDPKAWACYGLIVREILKEEKTIPQIATEHGIHPNLLRLSSGRWAVQWGV